MAHSQLKKLRSAARREADGDKGFTLVELMVVVLVIAILLAIAIPTFLGARERSQDRAAQSNLRNALTAAKVAFSNDGDYSGAFSTDLEAIEPRLTYLRPGAASTAEDGISVHVDAQCDPHVGETQANCTVAGTWSSNACSTGKEGRATLALCSLSGYWTSSGTFTREVWAGAVLSNSDSCFYLRDDSDTSGTSAGTRYGSKSSPGTTCTGVEAMKTTVSSDADW